MNKTFPYQKILEMKEKEKEAAQVQVARALHKQTRHEEKMSNLMHEFEQVSASLSNVQANRVKIDEIKMLDEYKADLRRRLQMEQTYFQQAKKNVDKKQEVLREKLKEEKTWKILKDNRIQEYKIWEKRQEQLRLDEIASTSFHRLSHIRGEEIGRE